MSKPALLPAGTNPAPTAEMWSTRRSYLTEGEVEAIIKAARCHRDATMVLVANRHGLRVSELVALKWRQVNLTQGHIAVERLKGGDDSVQPLSGREVRALRRIRREELLGTRFVFLSRLGSPLTSDAFADLLETRLTR